jgi:hypothetical protein
MPDNDNDFGGFMGAWDSKAWDDGRPRAAIARLGHGEIVEGIVCDALNLLQVQKLVEALIKIGEEEGYITESHHAAADSLPTSNNRPAHQSREDVEAILQEHAVKQD